MDIDLKKQINGIKILFSFVYIQTKNQGKDQKKIWILINLSELRQKERLFTFL